MAESGFRELVSALGLTRRPSDHRAAVAAAEKVVRWGRWLVVLLAFAIVLDLADAVIRFIHGHTVSGFVPLVIACILGTTVALWLRRLRADRQFLAEHALDSTSVRRS